MSTQRDVHAPTRSAAPRRTSSRDPARLLIPVLAAVVTLVLLVLFTIVMIDWVDEVLFV